MAVINWNEGSPAGADSASLGAGEFRSLKSALRTGLATEHVWPSASGEAGQHLLGSGRPFVGLQSAVSSTGTDGRLMHTSDTSRLFAVGSGGTSFIGGPTVLSLGSYPGTVPQRKYWAMEIGVGNTGASGSNSIVYPNSGFSNLPVVQVTKVEGASPGGRVNIGDVVDGTSFTAWSYKSTGAVASSVSFHWFAIGQRGF